MKKLLPTNPLQIISLFYLFFFVLSNLIAMLVGFLYEINFLYSFLISDIFIVAVLFLIFIFDKKLINSFSNLEKISKSKKIMVFLFWKIKYLPLFFLLLFSFLAMGQKFYFINNFGLFYGAIVTFIILLISEFFRIFYFSNKMKE